MITVEDLDVEALLRDYNRNEANRKLLQYYSSSSLWDILDKGRSETSHSAFLAWLFRKNGLLTSSKESPYWGLLDLIFWRLGKQHPEYYSNPLYQELKNGILTRSIVIGSGIVETEKPVIDLANDERKEEISNDAKSDALDIYLHIPVKGVTGLRDIEIIIENKIGSPEGKAKKTGAEGYSGMQQTSRYFWACNNEIEGTLKFFIFLKAMPSSDLDNIDPDNWPCSCPQFIVINYQDVYDFIIGPLLDGSSLRDRDVFIIKEYVRTLSMPVAFKESDKENGSGLIDHKKIILATTAEEQTQLTNYWNENQLLLLAALHAVENESEASKHDWSRCLIDNKLIVTKKSLIQHLFNVQLSNNKRSFNRSLIYSRSLFFESLGLDRSLARIPISKLTAEQTLEITNAIAAKDGNKPKTDSEEDKFEFIQDAIERFRSKAEPSIDKWTRDEFNSLKYRTEKNEMSFDIIDEENKVSAGKEKLDNVYNAIKEGAADILLGDHITSQVKEIQYGEQYSSLLNSFWTVNKDLVMAAVRVLSESERISDDDRKDITDVYNGLTKRDWATYSVSYKDLSRSNIHKTGVAEWFIQTLLWPGDRRGKPNVNEANSKLKDILGKDDIIIKQSDIVTAKQRNAYKTLHHADRSDSEYAFYIQGWTMDKYFGKLHDYLKSHPEYSIEYES